MSNETTVGAAYDKSLSESRYFNGRTVMAREAAQYRHQNPRITNLATSTVVDKVLLSDGSEVWQCRTCGDASWATVIGAISHAGSHNRKPRVPRGRDTFTSTRVVADEDLTNSQAGAIVVDDVSAAVASDLFDTIVESHVSTRRPSVVVPQDVRGVIRNLTAIKVQLGHMQDALAAATVELTRYAEGLTAGPTHAEVEELRAKASKYDQMRGLFS